ncbi:MAG: DAK2 domain-containing protein [Clostridia bacterium]|nr:DAK2 domain-containing protein [Clostridia bacterium]
MQKTINGATLRKMLVTSYSLLEENKDNIDALNIFPVPDGDTGTNMSLTLKSAVTEMNACESSTIEAISVAFNRGALKGARGNSGVILSQIIKGMFSELMKSAEAITMKDFARACEKGCETAYKAVTVPKEGTILTIIKAIAESAKQNVKSDTFQNYLHKIIEDAEKMLQMTPDMLPVLKKAGVVDAGGRGLVVIFSGMYKMLAGEMVNVEFVDKVEKDVTSEENHVNYESLADIRYGYCTEFFIINIHEKTTEADINSLRQHLLEIGDCVLCIGDLQLVKVHVHTNEPNKALGYALQLGELNGVKIENMLEQNRQLRKNAKKEEELKEYGIVAVAAGDGLNNVFKDIDVDYIISGGQTMNPSANDIATACDAVKAKTVFVLPNNKNIIMSAEQANDITSCKVVVIPTKTIPEGISAALAFDRNATVEENKEMMTEVISSVKSGSVTYAVRSTNIDGLDLHEGEVIGLDKHNILVHGNNIEDTTDQLIQKLVTNDTMNITLFYGEGVTSEQAEQFLATLELKYANCDVSMIEGGQPVYYYLISVE